MPVTPVAEAPNGIKYVPSYLAALSVGLLRRLCEAGVPVARHTASRKGSPSLSDIRRISDPDEGDIFQISDRITVSSFRLFVLVLSAQLAHKVGNPAGDFSLMRHFLRPVISTFYTDCGRRKGTSV